MEQRMSVVTLGVNDLARSKAFYQQALGWTVSADEGQIGARIWCELLIVLFKIHENIRKLADREA